MRVAVMSDIHGFDLALETVLADLDRQGPFDAVVVAGDSCEVGPAPAEVLTLVRTRDFVVLQGNTDLGIVTAARGHEGTAEDEYVAEQIGPAGIAYLAGLPFAHRITPPGGRSPDDDLLVVHANPHNLTDKLDPAASDDELRQIIGDTRAAAIAFGHHHVCYVRELDGTLLVDVSAVGNPKDGDLRCKYGILTWDEGDRSWRAELRKLDYPQEATAAQILASQLPEPEKVLRKLMRASY
ncbi:MAG TPA: metallophosphoesterase family protein [Thermomicrobiales bacterium]|jgi:predicted phosphodiesterase